MSWLLVKEKGLILKKREEDFVERKKQEEQRAHAEYVSYIERGEWNTWPSSILINNCYIAEHVWHNFILILIVSATCGKNPYSFTKF